MTLNDFIDKFFWPTRLSGTTAVAVYDLTESDAEQITDDLCSDPDITHCTYRPALCVDCNLSENCNYLSSKWGNLNVYRMTVANYREGHCIVVFVEKEERNDN